MFCKQCNPRLELKGLHCLASSIKTVGLLSFYCISCKQVRKNPLISSINDILSNNVFAAVVGVALQP